MRNDFAEIQVCCQGLLDQTGDSLHWEWVDYIGAVLAVFQSAEAHTVDVALDDHFTSRWDHKSIFQAPDSVRRIAADLGEIRAGQQLFVTQPQEDMIAFAAWWPWGDGESISVRIGLVSRNLDKIDAKKLHDEFVAWFTAGG